MPRLVSLVLLIGGALMALGPVLNLVQDEHLGSSGVVVLSLGVVVALFAVIGLTRDSRRTDG